MRKKAPKGWVKISEFASLTGLSVKTITAAMRRGTIPATEVARIGSAATAPYYLNPQTAAKEWHNNLNASHSLTPAVRTSLESFIRSITAKNKTAQYGNIASSDKLSSQDSLQPTAGHDKMTLAEAQRMEREAKARIALLELQEKESSLVSRGRINEQLFAAGKELRDALLAIPDRVTDLIMAEDNRAMVHNMLYDAIATELQKLADFQMGGNK